MQEFFSSLSDMPTFILKFMSGFSVDRYQNAIQRAMPLHKLKKVQLQEHFLTQDSIGHLQILCLSILLPSGGIESEWKRCSSPLSTEKMLGVCVWIQLKAQYQDKIKCPIQTWMIRNPSAVHLISRWDLKYRLIQQRHYCSVPEAKLQCMRSGVHIHPLSWMHIEC